MTSDEEAKNQLMDHVKEVAIDHFAGNEEY